MHVLSIQKWHVFHESIIFVKQHQMLVTTLLIVSLILVMLGIANSFVSLPVAESDRGAYTSENVEPLTRLSDPAYAPEYEVRKISITAALGQLLDAIQFERIYAVTYEYGGLKGLGGREAQVTEVFEVTLPDAEPQFVNLRGMSRSNWLQIQQNERALSVRSHSFFQSYGFELRNERDTPIGYIGFERKVGDIPFQDWEITQLRETATAIERVLLRPFEDSEHSSS